MVQKNRYEYCIVNWYSNMVNVQFLQHHGTSHFHHDTVNATANFLLSSQEFIVAVGSLEVLGKQR